MTATRAVALATLALALAAWYRESRPAPTCPLRIIGPSRNMHRSAIRAVNACAPTDTISLPRRRVLAIERAP